MALPREASLGILERASRAVGSWLEGPPGFSLPVGPSQGVFFAGVLFTMGLFTSWEVPGCLQPMDTLQQLAQ